MGLDVSHDAWRGAYSAFGRWRTGIARALGWPFLGDYYVVPDGGPQVTDETCEGIWSTEPEDAIYYLMNHSDCDGYIEPEHAGKLADRLTEILPLLPNGDGGGHLGDWREKTQRFIDGCRAAAAAGERLEFW